MAVTINDISRVTNLSKTVISKVLNNKPDVAEETRKMVLRVINEMGYVPNPRARELSLGVNKDVALVLPSDNIVYMRLLFLLYRRLTAEGYNISIHITDHDREKERAILRSIHAQRLRGIIYFEAPDTHKDVENLLHALSIPTVILGGEQENKGKLDRVYCHEQDMADTLVRLIATKGHPKIACLGMPDKKEYQRKRNLHLSRAFVKAGFSMDEVIFLMADDTSADEGYRLMASLPNEPLSVCLATNIFTGGVFRFMWEKALLMGTGKGLYEIFTLGDTSSLDELGLGYAYVSLPIEKLAEKASMMLIKRMNDKETSVKALKIAPFFYLH